MIMYVENPKESTEKLLEIINTFSKPQDTIATHRNQLYCYILATNNWNNNYKTHTQKYI